VSEDPPVTGPEIGESDSQFSKAKWNVEEEPELNKTF
jgi:hypothetical protein